MDDTGAAATYAAPKARRGILAGGEEGSGEAPGDGKEQAEEALSAENHHMLNSRKALMPPGFGAGSEAGIALPKRTGQSERAERRQPELRVQ
jgi:hypothetical protein